MYGVLNWTCKQRLVAPCGGVPLTPHLGPLRSPRGGCALPSHARPLSTGVHQSSWLQAGSAVEGVIGGQDLGCDGADDPQHSGLYVHYITKRTLRVVQT
jgi:hypothetical protein